MTTKVNFEPVKQRSSLPDIGVRKVEIGRIIDLPLCLPVQVKKLKRAMIIPEETIERELDMIETMNIQEENQLSDEDSVQITTGRAFKPRKTQMKGKWVTQMSTEFN